MSEKSQDKPNLDKQILETIQSLEVGSRQNLLYPASHPILVAAFTRLIAALKNLLVSIPKVTFGIVESKLVIESKAYEDRLPGVEGIKKLLVDKNIEGLTFNKDITDAELLIFLDFFKLKMSDIDEKGGWEQVLKDSNVKGISINQVKYQVAGEEIVGVEKSETVRSRIESLSRELALIKKRERRLGSIYKRIKALINDPEALEVLRQQLIDEGLDASEIDDIITQIKTSGILSDNQMVQLIRNMRSLIENAPSEEELLTQAIDMLTKAVPSDLCVGLLLHDDIAIVKADIDLSFSLVVSLINEMKVYDENAINRLTYKYLSDAKVNNDITPIFMRSKILFPLKGLKSEWGIISLAHHDSDIYNEEVCGRLLDLITELGLAFGAGYTDDEVKGFITNATQALERDKARTIFEKRRTEMVLESISAGLVVVNREGKISMMNSAAEKLFGVSALEKRGAKLTEEAGEGLMLALSKNIGEHETEQGVDRPQEIELISADETTKKIIQASSAVVQDEKGQTVGMVALLNDITKQKEIENMKAEFIADVTHELRSPLTAVKSAMSLFTSQKLGVLNDNQNKFLAIISNNVERLAKLVDTMLDISRMEAGMTKLDLNKISPAQLAHRVINNLQPLALDKNLELELIAEENLIPVAMDGNKIIQVITNLLSNAIKFSPDASRVIISTKIVDSVFGHDERGLQFSVKDVGIGIPKEEQAKIFMKFYQAKQPSATAKKGSGLGLSITQEIVRLHQGKIWVESEPNQGAEFFVVIPLDLEERTKVKEVKMG
jgi:PAS domain S-box-containing protein